MLAYKVDNVWTEWNQSIQRTNSNDGQLYSLLSQIDGTWGDAELAIYGLKKVILTPIPQGYSLLSYSLVEQNDGSVLQVLSTAPIEPLLPTPIVFGLAFLTIDDQGNVAGVDNAAGIGGAFLNDTGDLWVFLTDSQSSYVVFPQDGTGNLISVSEQQSDYFRLAITNSSNTPVNPTKVSIQLLKT
jgi:hypothetical protein